MKDKPTVLTESRAMFTVSDIACATCRSPRWVLNQVYEGRLKASFQQKIDKKTTRLFSLRDVRAYSNSIAESLIEYWNAKHAA
jgi:hypothetical protein